MATEKNISSRIINKHDTEVNWNKATNFIPKAGEIIVYDRDETYDYERFKIGDGITVVTSLPFGSIQSNWAQNDETAAGYVKNRTHWEENQEIILVDNVTVDMSSSTTATDPFEIELTEGEAYVVEFDGNTYECIAYVPDGQPLTIIGNGGLAGFSGGNEEPFVVGEVKTESGGNLFKVSANGTYAISIKQMSSTIHTIDSKYIPSSIQRTITGTPGQVVGFDENGNAIAQEAPSSLPDFDSSNEGQILVVKDSIPTWDNNKTTKLAVTDDGVLYLASI